MDRNITIQNIISCINWESIDPNTTIFSKDERNEMLSFMYSLLKQLDDDNLNQKSGDYAWEHGNSLNECTKLDNAYRAGYVDAIYNK